ncbi:MAG: sulfotransferase [Bacteroidota bacterium]|nr:sulfotransferase [Bacteroidota bacterium]
MSIIKKIQGLSLEDIKWLLEFGKPNKQTTIYNLRKNSFKGLKPPVFFLSTGRCGTKWFSEVMKHDKSSKVLHSPYPVLAVQSKLAYEILSDKKAIDKVKIDLLKEIILTARENHLRYSYKTDRRIIETNNYITFFAPVLAELFPQAKFVHLVRHPAEFVRSGLRRDYYTNSANDIKRIIPSGISAAEWQECSRIEKISHLWSETNSFVEKMKSDYPSQFYTFSFADFDTDDVQKMFGFIGVDVSDKVVASNINKPVNAQNHGNVQLFSDWNSEDKAKLVSICGKQAKKYGFKI